MRAITKEDLANIYDNLMPIHLKIYALINCF